MTKALVVGLNYWQNPNNALHITPSCKFKITLQIHHFPMFPLIYIFIINSSRDYVKN